MAKVRMGFDIGGSSLKVALLRGSKARVWQIRLPANMVDENGVIALPHAFVQFLKQTKKELSLPHAQAALVLPSAQTICRFVTMPRMTEEQLKLNLPYEFSDFVQDTGDQYHCDYALCEPTEGEDEESIPMMVAAASKRTLGEYAEMFAQAGIKLRTMLPQEMALLRLCGERGAGAEEFCFVDLGHQFTRVTAVKGDRVQATRQIALGGRNLDAAISRELGTNPYLSNTYKTTDFQDVLTLPAVMELCDRIAVEILKVINFYRFTYRSSNLDGVYLVGGGAALEPLRWSISGIVDMPLLHPEKFMPEAGEGAAAGIFAAGAAMGGE